MEQFIVFKSNNEKIAVDIFYIERIIEYQEPKKIPEGSKYLVGVIQYNKEVIPVIDLTYKLYGKKFELSDDRKIIIIDWKNTLIGFLIDDILGIENFEKDQYQTTNSSIEIMKDYIKGFIKTEEDEEEEDIIIVLDVDRLFTDEQSEELLSASAYDGDSN